MVDKQQNDAALPDKGTGASNDGNAMELRQLREQLAALRKQLEIQKAKHPNLSFVQYLLLSHILQDMQPSLIDARIRSHLEEIRDVIGEHLSLGAQ
jgi:hypothetical protein